MAEQRLAITYVDLDKIKPAPNNARTHSDEQVQQIADAISEFGWTNPLLLDERLSIIAGHGRLAAAKLLKFKTGPALILKGLSKAKRRALAIADNRIALNAGWDTEILTSELKALHSEGVDLSVLGFNEKELERYLEENGDGGDGDAELYEEGFSIIVELKNEEEQTKLLERLTDEGFKCKALIA